VSNLEQEIDDNPPFREAIAEVIAQPRADNYQTVDAICKVVGEYIEAESNRRAVAELNDFVNDVLDDIDIDILAVQQKYDWAHGQPREEMIQAIRSSMLDRISQLTGKGEV
jgi:hypothetical protein